jgi:hypothetical protein
MKKLKLLGKIFLIALAAVLAIAITYVLYVVLSYERIPDKVECEIDDIDREALATTWNVSR